MEWVFIGEVLGRNCKSLREVKIKIRRSYPGGVAGRSHLAVQCPFGMFQRTNLGSVYYEGFRRIIGEIKLGGLGERK